LWRPTIRDFTALAYASATRGFTPAGYPFSPHVARLPDGTIFKVLDDFEQGEQTQERRNGSQKKWPEVPRTTTPGLKREETRARLWGSHALFATPFKTLQ
jgi:hypothetical protein